jgi:ABC-type branched-subunit amino acid transport system substrate-binding protein
MAKLVPSTRLSDFHHAMETRLEQAIDMESKAFFYGALSYDHILAVAYAISAIKDAGDDVDRHTLMTYLRRMDFEGATGRITLVPGSNDRANMPVQIFNSHGYKSDGKTVDFVSVGSVDPVTGELTLDADAILWPGNTRRAPEP